MNFGDYADVKIAKDKSSKKYGMGIMYEHLINCVFNQNLNEGKEEERAKLISKIENDEWNTSPEVFYASVQKSKHKLKLTNYSIEDLSKMKTFTLDGYDIGYALKRYIDSEGNDLGFVELVSVHNNTGIGGLGDALIASAVKHGARYLDHFDDDNEFLTSLYSKYGFEEIDRVPYDPAYDTDLNYFKTYGRKDDIIYRKRK